MVFVKSPFIAVEPESKAACFRNLRLEDIELSIIVNQKPKIGRKMKYDYQYIAKINQRFLGACWKGLWWKQHHTTVRCPKPGVAGETRNSA